MFSKLLKILGLLMLILLVSNCGRLRNNKKSVLIERWNAFNQNISSHNFSKAYKIMHRSVQKQVSLEEWSQWLIKPDLSHAVPAVSVSLSNPQIVKFDEEYAIIQCTVNMSTSSECIRSFWVYEKGEWYWLTGDQVCGYNYDEEIARIKANQD